MWLWRKLAPYRQPVIDCKDLIAQSAEVESRLDVCYACDPFAEDLKESADILAELRAEQNELLQTADTLLDQLPADLGAVFAAWRTALVGRSEFMAALNDWWHNLTFMSRA